MLGCLYEKGRNLATLRSVRQATDASAAHRAIGNALPPLISSLLQPSEFENIRQRLLQLPEPPEHARLNARDFWGALGVFLLVFLSTFPVALPFIVMHKTIPAMRVSNLIAIVCCFLPAPRTAGASGGRRG